MAIEGAFAGKKAGATATDISGMACLPATAAPRTCLLINDENKSAQFATIQNDRLVVGRPVPLIGKTPDSRTLGSPPVETCREVDDFEEMDGEGVAYAEPYLYVVGSHGCSRSKGKFRLSSFILARVRVDRQGQPVDSADRPLAPENFSEAVETSYRVSDWLKRSGAAAGFFAKDLESADGLNIEGIAVQGDTIWFGLRGPIVKSPDKPVGDKGAAFLVGGDIADLFKPGTAPSKAEPRVIPVALEGLGIRDLALLPDQASARCRRRGPRTGSSIPACCRRSGQRRCETDRTARGSQTVCQRRDENRKSGGRNGPRRDGRQGTDRDPVRRSIGRCAAPVRDLDPKAELSSGEFSRSPCGSLIARIARAGIQAAF